MLGHDRAAQVLIGLQQHQIELQGALAAELQQPMRRRQARDAAAHDNNGLIHDDSFG